ncbi:MAG: alkaline phosphatase family protein, partial [Acidobacteria bacterium]|nr:alkaline phosphatase family protein [Acidobacteriota bacterium]
MPTLSRPARSLLTGGAALILLAAIMIPFSVSRVPAGSIGMAGDRQHGPGWFVRTPFSPVLIIPLSGGPLRFDLDRSTPEGATIRTRLTLDYRLDPGLFSGRAPDTIADGFKGFLHATIEEALHPFAPSTLLAPAAPAGGSGRAPAPRHALDAIDRALRASGVIPERLEGWVGPISAFSRPADGAATEQADGAIELGPMPQVTPTGARLVLIGLDGADWDVIDPLLRAGRMPHLAALIESGTRGQMRSYDPMISPLLWTTMVTGVGPDRHRIADFQAIDLASGRRVPMTSRFRGVKALWNILGDAGLSTGFVAWWASYPAEQVSGVQVSNLVAFEMLRPRPADQPSPRGIVFPSDYLEGLRDDLITASELSFEEARRIMRIERSEFEAAIEEVLRPPGAGEEALNRKLAKNPIPLVLSILTGSRNYATLAADLVARRFDLTAVYFEGIDMMGHRFQHCMPPRMAICPDRDFDRFSESVISFYVRQDALIGAIVDVAGNDATILIVSDHGFKSGAGRPLE